MAMRANQSSQLIGFSLNSLDPAMKQGYPFDDLKDRLLSQVKYQIQNKSLSKTYSQHQNPQTNNFNYANHQQNEGKNITEGLNCKILEEAFRNKSKKKVINNKVSSQTSICSDTEQQKVPNGKKKSVFQRVSIRYLRAKKHQIQAQSSRYQNFYSYTLSKIDKINRQHDKKARQTEKNQKICAQKRKKLQEIAEAQHNHQEECRKRNEILKSQVLDHRRKKEFILQKSREQNFYKAEKGRLHSLQLFYRHQRQSQKQICQKQMQFMKQKINELKVRNQMEKSKEQRLFQAKLRFKRKWLQELQSVQISNTVVLNKKAQVHRNIRLVLDYYSKALAQE